MIKKPRTTPKVVSVTLLSFTVLFVACKLQQNTVSADFARSAATVIDPSANGFRRMTAMSDARNQVKTAQDQAIYDKLKTYDRLSNQLAAANSEASVDYSEITGGETTCSKMEGGALSRDLLDDPTPQWTWNRCQKAKQAVQEIESLGPQAKQLAADIQKDLSPAGPN